MTSLVICNYREKDLGTLARLINEADQVDNAGFATTAEALAHELADPRIQALDNVFLAESHGELVGYVRLMWSQHENHDCLVARGIVHPNWRRRGIGTAMMKRAEERAAELKGTRPLFLDLIARGPVAGAAELAVSLGMQPARYFFYMECHDLSSLPEPVFPEGIVLRNYIVGQDEEAFVAAYNDGYSDHWGSVDHTLDQEIHRQGWPNFRPERNLLAVDRDGHIAGLCLLEFPKTEGDVPHSQPPMIGDLAVRPAYRRRGSGRALLLAGMQRIHNEGFSAVGLAVDADNPNKALRLYESVGFTVKSRSTVFRKELL